MLYAKFNRYWPSLSGEKIFKSLSVYFCYFVIYLNLERAAPFIWRNLNLHNSSMICASGPGEDDF